ncbi:MAG: cytochrome c peroxidase [Planctomycetota bacterium]
MKATKNRRTSGLARSVAAVFIAVGAAGVCLAEEVTYTSAAASSSPTRLGLPARPLMEQERRNEWIAELRDLYERPADQWPAPTLDADVAHRELGPLPPMVYPASNPPDKAKEALGRMLFYDPRLSGSGQLACASCHDPDLGWGDGRTVSFGHNRRELARNAPSILNSGYRLSMFWDGRAPTLEQQAKDVLANADEMHSGDELFIEKLAGIPGYVDRFREVFGVEDPTVDEVSLALAAFERTVVSSRTRFDKFLDGVSDALSDQEVAGLHLFRTDARCLNCHNGPLLTDDKFHSIGLSMYGRPFEDLGRYNETGEPEDVGAFRTPSLRDIARTAPYMHNGLFDMDEVLLLYNAGMPRESRRESRTDPIAPRPVKSKLIKPLGLNKQDLRDVAAFVATLSEPHRRVPTPRLPAGL